MPELQVANYIKYHIPLKFRISLSKLRCSVHKFNVETGRHRGVIYKQRLYILRDKDEIEGTMCVQNDVKDSINCV